MINTKAVILEKVNGPLVYEEIKTTKLKEGQVLVRVLASGLCGAQLLEIAGLKNNAAYMPHLLGHEGCGIVEEVGPGVDKVIPGQKVVMHWMIGSGADAAHPYYLYKGNAISGGKVTTLSELSVVSENRLTVVPYDTPEDICALLGCGMTTALGAVNNNAKVKIGESALVLGCGGLGLNLIQGLSLVGAFPITAVDIINKGFLAAAAGVDKFLNLSEVVFDDFNYKYDVIFDTTGNSTLISKAINKLSNNGRLIMVGQPKTDLVFNPLLLFRGKGQSIMATQGGDTNPDVDIPRYASMAIAGKLNSSKIVTHKFCMGDINTAVETLKTAICGRIILKP